MSEMNPEANFLDIKIMGREYRVACAPEERAALLSAVDLVDGKMREIAQRTRSTIAERVAVMVALNIAHEYLSKPGAARLDDKVDSADARRRMDAMGARIDSVLAPQRQLDI